MDWDQFWRRQFAKNQSGSPRWRVYTDPDSPEDKLMCAWIEKWHEDFAYFNNGGCGCCINIYEFDAPQEAVPEIPDDLIEPYRE